MVIKIVEKNNFVEKRMPIVKCLKEKIINDISSKELLKHFSNRTLYIKEENLSLKKIMNLKIEEVFSESSIPLNYPYGEMNLKEEDLINCKLEIVYRGGERSSYEFYKGNNR